jgi:parallel beta-helix repeat protein
VNNQILDNHIHHCGVYNKVAPAVFCALSDGNRIAHNLFEYTPEHAVNLGNSGYGRNIVEYNEIHFTCLETYDCSAIMCWMEDPDDRVERGVERSGHAIRWNLITDTVGCSVDREGNLQTGADGVLGIYLDSHSSNCLVVGNTVVRSGSWEGLRVNGGKNNLIENNVFMDNRRAISLDNPAMWIWPQMSGFMGSNHFCRNIVYRTQPDAEPTLVLRDDERDLPRVLAESDYNIFYNAGGAETTVSMHPHKTPRADLSLAEWRRLGYDQHSLVADPLFVDPARDDYRLQAGSPALRLGFQPIDFGRIGPRDKGEGR